MLTVDGDRAADTTRRIAAELAASPAAELVDMLVLDDRMALTASDRVRPIATVDEAVAAVKAAVESTRSALDLLGMPDTPTARRRHSAQHAWGVTVLISAAPLTPTDFDRLATLVQPRCGVAVVVPAARTKEHWSLSVDDTAILQPHGFELMPFELPAAVLESIDALLADATVGDAESALLGQADSPPHRRNPSTSLNSGQQSMTLRANLKSRFEYSGRSRSMASLRSTGGGLWSSSPTSRSTRTVSLAAS
ncbi:MAG: hypothetical protein IPG46_14110 [Actinobacteria bacterium]|nr:hypothetical protein [Actinomycetota bacterium]